jgi:hypothetical protein
MKRACIKCRNRLPEVLAFTSGGVDSYAVYCTEKDKWQGTVLGVDSKGKGGCLEYTPRLIGGSRIK